MPKSRSKRKRSQPPPKVNPKRSGTWVTALMLTFMLAGMIIIIANYLELFPGGTANYRLFLGLGSISAAFVTATRLH